MANTWILGQARGTVKSSGGSNALLAPVEYVIPPADGIHEPTCLATSPCGVDLSLDTPVTGTGSVDYKGWIRGISVVAMLDDKTCPVDGGVLCPFLGSKRLQTET